MCSNDVECSNNYHCLSGGCVECLIDVHCYSRERCCAPNKCCRDYHDDSFPQFYLIPIFITIGMVILICSISCVVGICVRRTNNHGARASTTTNCYPAQPEFRQAVAQNTAPHYSLQSIAYPEGFHRTVTNSGPIPLYQYPDLPPSYESAVDVDKRQELGE